MDKFDPAGEMDRSMWDRVIAINLTAPAMVTKRAVNMFLKHETPGAIVNIASIAGTRGYASGAAYTASKHGILGLTKNTGVYYAPQGIRCNAIMAGGMNTNIASAFMNGLNMEGLKTMRKTCKFKTRDTRLIILGKSTKWTRSSRGALPDCFDRENSEARVLPLLRRRRNR